MSKFKVIPGGSTAEPKPKREIKRAKKHRAPTALPIKYQHSDGSIRWPEMSAKTGTWLPKASCVNATIAILALGIECSYDTFHDKRLVGGRTISQWAGELTDDAIHMLRVLIQDKFEFDPGTGNTADAAVQLCIQNPFDPVCEYLDSLTWDGVRRLDKWLISYMGAADTEFNTQAGRLSLIAAARRARHPGTKFDQIVVLEGREGTNKSTAIKVLAGEGNFSDQTILNLDDRQQMEQIQGVWLYEIADMTGMKGSDVEAMKAFASRTEDRARPAYGRFKAIRPRRCVFFATTNEDRYLKSQTGNRRFWPVKTGEIDIEGLKRDRDQIWAEAAALEAEGASIVLSEHLWAVARAEQEERRQVDPWEDILADERGKRIENEDRVFSRQLLTLNLKIPEERQTRASELRLGACMRQLGWDGPKTLRIGFDRKKGYSRCANGRPAPLSLDEE